MASPLRLKKTGFTETKNLEIRKAKISEILKTYTFDEFNNSTLSS